ncbi:MAG TPA: hypothetical protein DER09_11435 [Prolixibacteraceae bacterium]|nr:hypothetical protein [Prolixibacteraceae bacterium]
MITTTKTINRLFLMFFFVLVSLVAFAQSKSDKMYDAFANKDGVSSFTFSKNMIDAIDINLGDDGDEKQVTGDLHQVRFMSYNPEKGSLTGAQFCDKAIGYLPKSRYHKFVDDEPGNDAEIWLMGGKKKFTECHVFVHNENASGLQFVVSFYGDFTVSDIDKLKKSGKGFSED